MKSAEPWIMIVGLILIAGLAIWYSTRTTVRKDDAPRVSTSPESLCESINNPGCIKDNGITKWLGSNGQEKGFVRFTEPLWGIRAMAIILRTYRQKYGLRTISAIIHRWAPESENNTIAYIGTVSDITGIKPNEQLTTVGDYVQLIAAMIRVEMGKMPYSTHLISSAVIRAQIL